MNETKGSDGVDGKDGKPPLAPPVGVKFTEDEKAEIDKIVACTGINRSEVIRRAVRLLIIEVKAHDGDASFIAEIASVNSPLPKRLRLPPYRNEMPWTPRPHDPRRSRT